MCSCIKCLSENGVLFADGFFPVSLSQQMHHAFSVLKQNSTVFSPISKMPRKKLHLLIASESIRKGTFHNSYTSLIYSLTVFLSVLYIPIHDFYSIFICFTTTCLGVSVSAQLLFNRTSIISTFPRCNSWGRNF